MLSVSVHSALLTPNLLSIGVNRFFQGLSESQISRTGIEQGGKEPAEDGDGEGVGNDADDGNDNGGMPAEVQGDLIQELHLLLCRVL